MSDLQSTLNKIKDLQKAEERLYKTLTMNAQYVASGKKNTLSNTEITEITTQINTLSASRTNLYNLISTLYQQEVKNTGSLKTSYDQQIHTLEMLEIQLSKSKKKLSELKDEKYNQLKMIEINTYYSKQYDAYRRFFRIITIIGICILCTFVLDYFPRVSFLASPTRKLIYIVGGFIILRRLLNMYRRSYTDYDEFEWPHAPTSLKDLTYANSSQPVLDVSGIDLPDYLCAAGGCCGLGTIWKDEGGCVLDPNYTE
jgi:hypothetical protein